jgi:OCT family organic cation transporter-like MFS transporter 4/5
MGNGIQFGGAIGYILLPGVAYLCRDFRLIQLVITVPEILFLIGCFFLPESPRWLLLNGRTGRAEEVMMAAASCNKLPVNKLKEQISYLTAKFRDEGNEKSSSVSLSSLWRSRNLRKRTIALYVTW